MKVPKRFGTVFLAVAMLFSLSTPCFAASDIQVTITNNVDGIKDTVAVKGLKSKDTVNVYADSGAATLLGSARASYTGSVTIRIDQLGADGGVIYIAVTASDGTVGSLNSYPFEPEGQSGEPDIANITISNYAGTRDTITVKGLKYGDKIQVYKNADDTAPIGYAKAAYSGTATVKLEQLGDTSGSVYITNTTFGKKESKRVEVPFDSEQQTPDLDADSVTITNYALGTKDTVAVKGLKSGDKIQVYNDSEKTVLLGSGRAISSGSALIKIPQIGVSGGTLYISNTRSGMLESNLISISFDAEAQTDVVDASLITLQNNAAGTKDVITVSGLKKSDVVRVYSSDASKTLLGSATASALGIATVSVPQLGAEGGTVLITRTGYGLLEGDPITVSFGAEMPSETLSAANNVSVTNNAGGMKDTVFANNLTKGDTIRVYADSEKQNLLGSGLAKGSTLTISITQIGASGGTLYLTRTGVGLKESAVFPVDFIAEKQTPALDPSSSITVTNNISGIKDTIEVKGLSKGDRIRVYADAERKTLLGSAAVLSTSNGTVTVKLDLPSPNGGSVYITNTAYGDSESEPAELTYGTTAQTPTPDISSIVINNYKPGVSDTVIVGKLKNGDVVKVYSTAGSLLGSATAGTTGTATVKIAQLDDAGTSVDIKITGWGKTESEAVTVSFGNDKSAEPDINYVTVTNNGPGLSDIVSVSILSTGDEIKVYDSQNTLLGKSTAGSTGTVTIKISQIGENGGTLYLTRTSTNKLESNPISINFKAEKSTPPSADNITVTNNPAGTNDTVAVTGLSKDDIVYVYSFDGTNYKCIATGTADADLLTSTITIEQLGTAGGKIYISVKSAEQLESDKTEVAFTAEA